jgi:hypothetical protein
MAGVAGRSGRKPGDTHWAEAIKRAIKRRQEKDPLALERLADVLLSKCYEGDLAAIKELGDRLDGKPKQQLDVTTRRDVRGLTDDDLIAVIQDAGSEGTFGEEGHSSKPH